MRMLYPAGKTGHAANRSGGIPFVVSQTEREMMKKGLIVTICSLLLLPALASAAGWPPESGARVPGNALEYPTKLEALNQSLEKLLNGGAKIVSASLGNDGPVVILNNKKQSVICLVKGAGSGSDQNVATSRCYAMN